jgi:hypothetical protein
MIKYMPIKAINYQDTVIYKIQHIEKDKLIYIGHTTNFTKRKCKHKSNCNSEKSKNYNQKVYQTIRENGGWESFNMIELYKFPCNDTREAACEEDKVMREYKSCMNIRRAFTTPEEKIKQSTEYREMNKDKLKKISAEYRENNKGSVKKQMQQYKNDHKDNIKEYMQQYKIDNKDRLKDYRRQFRQENKDKLCEKCSCLCGGKYTHEHKKGHLRSLKHLKYLETIESNNPKL